MLADEPAVVFIAKVVYDASQSKDGEAQTAVDHIEEA